MRYRGFLTDGRTSARREVLVQPVGQGLRLYDAGGDALADWPYDGLRLLEEVYPGRPVRLRHRRRGEATLTLDTPELLDALELRTRRRLRGHWLLRPRGPAVAVWAVVLVAGLVLVGWGLPLLVGPITNLVPAEWEGPLGEAVAESLNEGGAFCETPSGIAALQGLQARLLAGTEPPYPIRIRVSPRPVTNAFAAPGGEIVLMKGLLTEAKSGEEVAGVLAHELAHSLERHPLQGLVRAVGLRLVFAAILGDASALDSLAGQMGQAAVLFSYTRADELEADRIGVDLLNRADIRGEGLLAFFQRLQGEEGDSGGLPTLLSSHPVHQERIDVIRREAHGRGDALTGAEWLALRGICDDTTARR